MHTAIAMRALPRAQVARVLERIAPDRALVLIISGMMGNRGTVFKSADKKLHLTDMFLHISETASQQVRIDHHLGKHTRIVLRLFTSTPDPTFARSTRYKWRAACAGATMTTQRCGCFARSAATWSSCACKTSRTLS